MGGPDPPIGEAELASDRGFTAQLTPRANLGQRFVGELEIEIDKPQCERRNLPSAAEQVHRLGCDRIDLLSVSSLQHLVVTHAVGVPFARRQNSDQPGLRNGRGNCCRHEADFLFEPLPSLSRGGAEMWC